MTRQSKLPPPLQQKAQKILASYRQDGEAISAEDLAIEAIHEHSGALDYDDAARDAYKKNKYYHLLVNYIKKLLLPRRARGEVIRMSDRNGRGSIVRVSYLAASLPVVRELRENLWGTPDPLVQAQDIETLWQVVDEVWQWVTESPEVQFYKETALVEVGAEAAETRRFPERELYKTLHFPKRQANGDVVLSRPV